MGIVFFSGQKGDDSVAASALAAIDAVQRKDFIRGLQIMLNQTKSSTNINAWADVLDDDLMINNAISSGYVLNEGKLVSESNTISQPSYSSTEYFGASSTNQVKWGQTFTAELSGGIAYIDVHLRRTSSIPADGLRINVYESDKTTLIGTSDNVVLGSELTTSCTPTRLILLV